MGETTFQANRVLQLSSPQITPGFSGAPVLDAVTGRVVGMATTIAVPDRYGRLTETAFVTPTETLRAVCPALLPREIAWMAHDDLVRVVAFSPDGKHLATASSDRTARVWLWRPDDLVAEACARLASNLTKDEWRIYLRDEPYGKTCPNLP